MRQCLILIEYDGIKNNIKAVQKQYVVFDDNNRTVWICWYEEGLL